MSETAAPPPSQVLLRLFRTLFLRGRTLHNLGGASASLSLVRKFGLILLLYAAIGCMTLMLVKQPTFGFSLYLHALTFVFVGNLLAGSSGEILFNREEAEIMLHLPIHPSALLWAKLRVMAEMALALILAFNLAPLVGGCCIRPDGVAFLFGHLLSSLLMALFTAGSVVLAYQLCMRWFGRKRLESMLTFSQVLVAVGTMFMGQVPRLFLGPNNTLPATLDAHNAWLGLLPPAWFAGLNDLVAGNRGPASWALALLAVGGTLLVLRLALGSLAESFQAGILELGEAPTAPSLGRRCWYAKAATLPPLAWALRNPVSRASFVLTLTYLGRDRDTKLRFYPGMAPILILPLILLLQSREGSGLGFMMVFIVAFMSFLPFSAREILQHSQQWKAAEVFRLAPLSGPAPVCDGVRWAILVVVVLPMLLGVASILIFIPAARVYAPVTLSGLFLLPVMAQLPGSAGWVAPFSMPPVEGAPANRALQGVLVMFLSLALSGAALAARNFGVLGPFLGVEGTGAAVVWLFLRRAAKRASWPVKAE